MNPFNCLRVCTCLVLILWQVKAYSQNLGVEASSQKRLDTSAAVALNTSEEVKVIKNEQPIILQKGELLTVPIHNETNQPIQVRIHSSLGRLVKHFRNVTQQISMPTGHLLPGIYMVIIKKPGLREVRKVFLTE